MSMHIPSSIDTDSSSIATLLSRTGPIVTPLSPAAQSDILGILQREQDHAISLLSLSPLLSSLFISYAKRAAALEALSATPSPESEWKAVQDTIVALQEENAKLKSEKREVVGKLAGAEASQEAFRSQVSSLSEVNATQHDDMESLRTQLSEAKDKYDRLMADSNTKMAAVGAQISALEAQRGELKEAIVEQQIKISKLESRIPDDSWSHSRPSSPPPRPSTRGSPVLPVESLLPPLSTSYGVGRLISVPPSPSTLRKPILYPGSRGLISGKKRSGPGEP